MYIVTLFQSNTEINHNVVHPYHGILPRHKKEQTRGGKKKKKKNKLLKYYVKSLRASRELCCVKKVHIKRSHTVKLNLLKFL